MCVFFNVGFRLSDSWDSANWKIMKEYQPSLKTPIRPQIQRLWALPLQNFSPALAAKTFKLRRVPLTTSQCAYDVDPLCRGTFMDRARDLKAHGGERLNH